MSSLKPDYKAVLEFLRWYNPLGPWWSLTSIPTDQKGTFTRTFSVNEWELLEAWLREQNEKLKRSVYFTLNSVRDRFSSKPNREGISEVRWLHVDLDPRLKEDLASEQARLLKLATSPAPAGLPNPTFVTFSGGGYQMFWRLRDPIPIRDLAHAEELKRYNLQIERLLGGDSCHNIDRLMRLPGSVNWLNKKKAAAGRVPMLAAIVEQHDDRIYDLTEFRPAPELQNATTGFSTGASVKTSANIRRLTSVDELPKGVSDLAKVVIVQGLDPDEPQRWKSRSEAVWFVACELARAETDDDTFFSVLTDPSFAISAHILDQKNSEEAAKRTIERAREYAIDPQLAEMNEKHAVIGDLGGRCRIVGEVYDHAMKRARLSRQSFEDFANRYCHQKVIVPGPKGDVQVPLGKWWVHHPNRRQYDTMVFAPGQTIEGAYNLWRGYAFKAKPGDCSLFIEHVKRVICKDDKTCYDYLLRWMAYVVQEPGSPGQIALVMKGRMGTGKSFFAKHFGALFGRHYLPVSDPKHLVGSFNAHLRDCVLLFADEAFYAGDKKHESILKTLITEDTIAVEAKGVDVELQRNCVHVMMASNESWAVPADLGDRRFFVLNVSDRRRLDAEYFGAIEAQLKAGGYEALLDYLLNLDLKGWDVRNRPKTDALLEEKLNSLSVEFDWWYTCLRDGQIEPNVPAWPLDIPTVALHASILRHVKSWRGLSMRSSATRIGMFLKRVVPGGVKPARLGGVYSYIDENSREVTKANPHAYRLPSLAACRKHWEENFDLLEPWPEESPAETPKLDYDAVLK